MEGANPNPRIIPSIGLNRVGYFYLRTEAEPGHETACFSFITEQ
jgi:hypothetical protein